MCQIHHAPGWLPLISKLSHKKVCNASDTYIRSCCCWALPFPRAAGFSDEEEDGDRDSVGDGPQPSRAARRHVTHSGVLGQGGGQCLGLIPGVERFCPPCQDQLQAAPMRAEASVPGKGALGVPSPRDSRLSLGIPNPFSSLDKPAAPPPPAGKQPVIPASTSVPGVIVNSSPKHSCSGQWDSPVHDGGSPGQPALGWLPMANTTNIPFSHGEYVPSSPSDGSA